MKLCQTAVVGQDTGGHVAHQHHGDHYLVGRETQKKCRYDDSVYADESAERIEDFCAFVQQGYVACFDVGQKPYDDAEGCGYHDGSSQDEDGAVQHRPDDDTYDLWFSVWREFQYERGWYSF